MLTKCLALFLVTIALMLGCSAGTSNTSLSANGTVHATPSDCYATMIRAGVERDHPLLLSCLSVADGNLYVGNIAYRVEREVFFRTDKSDAAQQLLKDNGLDGIDIMGQMQIRSMPGGGGINPVLKAVGAKVIDQPAFLGNAALILDPQPKPAAVPEVLDERMLTDVIFDGDTAVGMIAIPQSDQKATVRFAKKNGSWVIDLDGSTQ